MPHRVAVLPAALLALACLAASAEAGAEQQTRVAQQSAAVHAAAPKLLKFGQSVRAKGEKGNWLRVSPVGVYYHRPTWGPTTKPRNKYFLALAVRVTAVSKADSMPLPYGSQWRIKQGNRVFTTTSGKANSAPWVGRAQGAWVTVHPSSPEVVYEAFDVPAKGGVLEWSGPTGLYRWRIPANNAGKATHEAVLDAIADYEGR
ncbi:hypothetical protein [Nonomuraea basaltis]|uniref:hypothetical protein n=1 Tax=Nonomuraea basaltis TaxID=2495887 RepID=UPI00110C5772|nr:hypothetical protein [Nonomuraea basaltis]TMR92408.1 hypothetical protein EJK15_44790 [Nonomuraea basaltis]